MLYLIHCEDSDDSFEKRRHTQHAHLQHLDALQQQHRLIMAGVLYGDDSVDNPLIAGFKGSVVIAEFSGMTEAKSWIAADPYVTAGVFIRISIYPFKKVSL